MTDIAKIHAHFSTLTQFFTQFHMKILMIQVCGCWTPLMIDNGCMRILGCKYLILSSIFEEIMTDEWKYHMQKMHFLEP